MRNARKAAFDAQQQLKPDTTIYSVSTGTIDVFNKSSRHAVQYVSTLEGLLGMTPYQQQGTIWYFDSLNSAKVARNMMESKGIKCGNNICKFHVCDDGVPEMEGVCE